MRTLAVPTRLNWIALLLTVGATLSLFACSSMATTWLMPQRALSPQEWLAYDLSGADVAGVATLVAVRDTVVDIAADGSGLPARVLVLEVSQWLKGAHTLLKSFDTLEYL